MVVEGSLTQDCRSEVEDRLSPLDGRGMVAEGLPAFLCLSASTKCSNEAKKGAFVMQS